MPASRSFHSTCQRLLDFCRRPGSHALAADHGTYAEKGAAVFSRFHTHTTAKEEIQCLQKALGYFQKALAAGEETPELLFSLMKCFSFLGRNREFDAMLERYFAARRRDAAFVEFERSGKLYLPASCIKILGCMGYLTTYIMAQELTGRHQTFIVCTPQEDICNRSFLSYFSPYIALVTEPQAIAAQREARDAYETPIDWGVEYKDYTGIIHRVAARTSNDWHDQGRAPLLRLRDDHRARGRQALRAHGIDPDAWYVCLHARTSGFHPDGREKEAFRNADIETYRKAIKAIVAQGGRVLRMGDPSMPRFEAEGVMDYAHSPLKSDWMDVYLLSQCRFFLGTSSGPHKIPFSFGVPCVQTNAAPVGYMPFAPIDVVLPKLLRHRRGGRLLRFREMLREPYSWAAMQYLYDALGVETVGNTEDEIGDAVEDMLASFQGDKRVVPPLTALQRQFNAWADESGLSVACRVDARFLARHAALMKR